jgi:hypothetical protein
MGYGEMSGKQIVNLRGFQSIEHEYRGFTKQIDTLSFFSPSLTLSYPNI